MILLSRRCSLNQPQEADEHRKGFRLSNARTGYVFNTNCIDEFAPSPVFVQSAADRPTKSQQHIIMAKVKEADAIATLPPGS